MTSVYLHKFPNGKVYVGIAEDLASRWQNGYGYVDNTTMYADILRYGWKNVRHFILAECRTRAEALRLEREFIRLYDSEHPKKGYNRTGVLGSPKGSRIAEARKVFKKAIKEAGLDPNKLRLNSQGTSYGVYYSNYFIGYYYMAQGTFSYRTKNRNVHRLNDPNAEPLHIVLLRAIAEVLTA